MSLIAEALKKAEQQQRLAPNAATVSPAAPPKAKPPRRNGLWLLLILISLLTAAAAGFVWWTESLKPSPAPPQATIIPEPPPVEPVMPELAKEPVAAEPAEPAPAEPELVQQPQKPPAPALSLTGIVRGASAKDSFALINNKTLREGDIIEGLTVIAIGEKGAELRNESGEIQFLTLEN